MRSGALNTIKLCIAAQKYQKFIFGYHIEVWCIEYYHAVHCRSEPLTKLVDIFMICDYKNDVKATGSIVPYKFPNAWKDRWFMIYMQSTRLTEPKSWAAAAIPLSQFSRSPEGLSSKTFKGDTGHILRWEQSKIISAYLCKHKLIFGYHIEDWKVFQYTWRAP